MLSWIKPQIEKWRSLHPQNETRCPAFRPLPRSLQERVPNVIGMHPGFNQWDIHTKFVTQIFKTPYATWEHHPSLQCYEYLLICNQWSYTIMLFQIRYIQVQRKFMLWIKWRAAGKCEADDICLYFSSRENETAYFSLFWHLLNSNILCI